MLKSVKTVQQRLIEGRQRTLGSVWGVALTNTKGLSSFHESLVQESSGPLEAHLVEAHTIRNSPSRDLFFTK